MSFDEQVWAAEVEQRAESAGESMKRLVKTIAALRQPQTGCPWDLQQDHRSLRRFMLEEAYEAAEAMLAGHSPELIDELGDVLLQVVLNAQLVSERHEGGIVEVINGLDTKMRRRHPHVFNPQTGVTLEPFQVKEAWEDIKKAERIANASAEQPRRTSSTSTFASEEKIVPALTQAYKIGKKAKSIQFDWREAAEVLEQVRAELGELETEIKLSQKEKIERELGDVFFTLAQLSRHLGFEPEAVAQLGNIKFLKRFERVEALAKAEGHPVKKVSQAELERLWQDAKQDEKK